MAMNQDEVSKELETFKNLLDSVLESLQVEEVGNVGEEFDPSIPKILIDKSLLIQVFENFKI